MLQILVVEDNLSKQDNIRQIILDNSNLKKEFVHVVNCTKEAKKLLYENYYDLMILDLVLPLEFGEEANAKNGLMLLEDIHSSPMIKPPLYIIGLSGFDDLVEQHHKDFQKKLWHLISYEADTTNWQEQIKNIIYHLVKTRKRFIQTSLQKDLVDIAIVTALPKPELEAILKLDGGNWASFTVENDITKYYQKTFKVGEKVRTVIAATADQMGMTASTCLATKMMLYFRPKYLIMGGIVAGIKDRDLGFGDILVAEQCWDYGSGKIVESEPGLDGISDVSFEQDPRPVQLSPELKSKISAILLTGNEILDKIQNEWQGETPSTKLKLHLGPIASGSYVIASGAILNSIKQQQRKLLGVEMESYGVYYSGEHSTEPKTQVISIKSVCDYGDGKKNDRFQKYAAYTSARFIYDFIMREL